MGNTVLIRTKTEGNRGINGKLRRKPQASLSATLPPCLIFFFFGNGFSYGCRYGFQRCYQQPPLVFVSFRVSYWNLPPLVSFKQGCQKAVDRLQLTFLLSNSNFDK